MQLTKTWFAVLLLVAAFACSSPSKPDTTNKPTPPAPTEPTAGTCTSDGDCRLFSDYCTGCDCRALGKDDKEPTCSGPGVKCIADPCMTKTAVCEAGKCMAKDKAP